MSSIAFSLAFVKCPLSTFAAVRQPPYGGRGRRGDRRAAERQGIPALIWSGAQRRDSLARGPRTAQNPEPATSRGRHPEPHRQAAPGRGRGRAAGQAKIEQNRNLFCPILCFGQKSDFVPFWRQGSRNRRAAASEGEARAGGRGRDRRRPGADPDRRDAPPDRYRRRLPRAETCRRAEPSEATGGRGPGPQHGESRKRRRGHGHRRPTGAAGISSRPKPEGRAQRGRGTGRGPGPRTGESQERQRATGARRPTGYRTSFRELVHRLRHHLIYT